MDENVKFEGAKIAIGGRDFIVPPLTFKQLRRLKERIESLKEATLKPGDLSGEQLDAMAEIIHAALSRNYPELTREDLEDLLDLGNLGPMIKAVMGQSGFVQGGKEAESGQTGTRSTAK